MEKYVLEGKAKSPLSNLSQNSKTSKVYIFPTEDHPCPGTGKRARMVTRLLTKTPENLEVQPKMEHQKLQDLKINLTLIWARGKIIIEE